MKKQVLIIGKDQTICDRLQMALYDEDIIVDFADSSAAIEELAEEAHYCLLILDTRREILFRSYSTKRLGKSVDIEICSEQIRSMIQQEFVEARAENEITFFCSICRSADFYQ